MSFTLPPFLQSGDLILVIAPSFSALEPEVRSGIQRLESYGFRVEAGPSVFREWGKFAGTDAQRFADLQWALDHPSAKAVFCTRGGYGLSRIWNSLQWDNFRRSPKWMVGFSDITLLHQLAQREGVASLHGPMVVHFSREEQRPAFQKEVDFLVSGMELSYRLQASPPIEGVTEGVLLGGNLTLLAHLAGHFQPDFFDGSVLFLEEVGENFFRIDRMLEQMKMAGWLSRPKAVVLGQFTECDPDRFPLSVADMVMEKTEGKIPVFSGLEAGHGVPTFPVVLGHSVRLEPDGPHTRFIQTMRTPTF